MIAGIAVVAGVWIVLACVGLPGTAWAIGRMKRRARRTFTDWTFTRPPVPNLVAVTDADWLADQPAEVLPADATDEQLEQAIFDALFRSIPEVAEDLRGAA